MLNRRSLLKWLGVGTGAAVVAPVAGQFVVKEPPKPAHTPLPAGRGYPFVIHVQREYTVKWVQDGGAFPVANKQTYKRINNRDEALQELAELYRRGHEAEAARLTSRIREAENAR